RQAQQQGAMNSLYDPELAEEFSAMFRLDSLARMETDLIRDKKFTGDALYEALYRKLTGVDDNIRYPDVAGGCFIKGTMVHTREGLKPIEEIKVGDYVLSSPENKPGIREYKRVVNTFVHKNKTIRHLGIRNQEGQTEIVAATGNHPFWVEGVGWTRADLLKKGTVVRFADGSISRVAYQVPVYKFIDNKNCVVPNIGFTYTGRFPPLADPVGGGLFDYENYQLPANQRGEIGWEEMTEENYLEVTVYNIEVEDFHTYYVSSMGVWVHNVNCTGVSLANGTGVLPPGDKPLFDGDAHINAVIRDLGLQTGWAVVRSRTHGLRDRADDALRQLFKTANNDSSIPTKELQNWLQFEDGVVGRLAYKDARYEYVVFYKNAGENGRNFLRVEGREVVNGFDVFVDRKLSMGKLFDKDGNIIDGDDLFGNSGSLDLLWRITQALEQNPSMKWRFEMPALKKSLGEGLDAMLKAQGRQMENLFDALRNAKMDYKVPGPVLDAKTNKFVDGYVTLDNVITAADAANNPVFKDFIGKTESEARMMLIERMVRQGRIELQAVEQIKPQKQDINYEGSAYATDLLEMSDIEWTLGQAKQYWLDAGVAPSVFDGVRFSIADLPEGQAGLAEGKHITLDASGAGWGWFVDDTLENSSEFILPESATSFRALSGSPAHDKIDLLTVMIHELGHVLGLPSVSASGGIMSQYLSPGLHFSRCGGSWASGGRNWKEQTMRIPATDRGLQNAQRARPVPCLPSSVS
ncbi:MAG: matrixin family metalloprotease, partial [Zoogloeaceae bacterium]|nr:matrixin family metalloprotease [Zoogloeaceae bacterium]